MKQPQLSNGVETASGMVIVMDKAMQGANDANRLWVEHCDKFIKSWGCVENFGAALGAGVRAIRFVPPPPPSSVGFGVTSVLYNY
jgi:hypothetical protein